ncbi:MAG: cysteine synthase A [Eubacteriales bacterium]
MKKIYTYTDLIGKTPLVSLGNLHPEGNVLAKLEYYNPAGSIKDRAACQMVLDGEADGRLTPGATIIEPTSGNTGIGLAAIAASRGYKLVLTMPASMSIERRNLLKAYGATVVLTEPSLGMQGAVDKAEELAKETPNSFLAGQFFNPSNPKAHTMSTGPELIADTDGKIDILVAGVGTGGTVSGCGAYLKQHLPHVKIVAVEPAKSPLLSEGKVGPHGIQGIGANFVPENMDVSVVDEIITVTDENAMIIGRSMAQKEGYLVGISSGAAVWAALELAKRPENVGKTIVAICPDTGERYLSTAMFSENV